MSNQKLKKYLSQFGIAEQHRLLKGVSYLFIIFDCVFNENYCFDFTID